MLPEPIRGFHESRTATSTTASPAQGRPWGEPTITGSNAADVRVRVGQDLDLTGASMCRSRLFGSTLGFPGSSSFNAGPLITSGPQRFLGTIQGRLDESEAEKRLE